MSDDSIVVDGRSGERITVGARVKVDDEQPAGTVTAISDPDQDADEEGRPRPINPVVTVQWDDCDEPERLTTSFYGGGFGGEDPLWEADELELIPEPASMSEGGEV